MEPQLELKPSVSVEKLLVLPQVVMIRELVL
jgi:hypothetical protein